MYQGVRVRAVEGTREAYTVTLACLGPGVRIGSSFYVKSLFRVYSLPSTNVRNVPCILSFVWQ